MRLLVVDESGVLPWLVAHLGGPEVEVKAVDSYAAALAAVARDGLDAAVVSLSPARLPWQQFQRACAQHAPPIPVLYESCMAANLDEAGISASDGTALFLRKPAPRAELAAVLEELMAIATRRFSTPPT